MATQWNFEYVYSSCLMSHTIKLGILWTRQFVLFLGNESCLHTVILGIL